MWSTTSGWAKSSTSCCRLSVRSRPGTPIAQSGCARNRSLSALTISGSIHSPNLSPRRVDVARQRLEPARQLAQVDGPVAERRVVVVAAPEPAVVEDEQLDAQARRLARDRDEPVVVEVEVGPLPVVEHHRPRAVAPRAPRQPIPVQPVERLGEAAQALAGPGDHRLGRRERRARLEPPRERLGVDAEAQPRGPERVDLRLGEEVAGVDEAQAAGLAGVLGRRRAAQGEERAVLGAARARAGCPTDWRPGTSGRS